MGFFLNLLIIKVNLVFMVIMVDPEVILEITLVTLPTITTIGVLITRTTGILIISIVVLMITTVIMVVRPIVSTGG